MTRYSGRQAWCGVCGEVVYDFPEGVPLVIQNLDCTRLPDGRARWFSRDFQAVIHECPQDWISAAAERMVVSLESRPTFDFISRPIPGIDTERVAEVVR